jgi:hypothetical protein
MEEQMIEIDGELKHVVEIAGMYSLGHFLPLSFPNQFKLVKSIWENNQAVMTFNQDENFVLWYNKFKSLFLGNKMKTLRMMCILMFVYQGVLDTTNPDEVTIGPVHMWLIELTKEGFNKPTKEIVEILVKKHIEDQAERHEIKVLEAIDDIVDYVKRNHKKEAYFKTALDICFHYKTEDRVEGMLDTFSEELQEWYENKLKESEGDIAGDAEWMKELYADVKLIYEASSSKPKVEKKKKKKNKKVKAPPIPRAPSMDTIISTGNEVIVWSGGDIYEEIVLVKGVF